jgi:hypothetical protein
MPDLGTNIVVHKIPLIEGRKPIKQKLRWMRLDMLLKVNVEIQKLWDARFLDVIHFPQ